MEYEVGKWYGWNGGKCPVHPKSLVAGIYLDGGKTDRHSMVDDFAEEFDWEYKYDFRLVSFRVIKPYVEQKKEYTIDPRKHIIWYGAEDDLVHVREV